MDSRRQLWVAMGVIVAVVAAVTLLISPEGRLAQDARLTSYRTTPDGVGALYALLDTMGVTVDRRQEPYRDAEPLDDPIVLFHPIHPFTPGEIGEMMTWLRDGGTLFYVAYESNSVLDSLGLDLEILPPESVIDLSCITETAEVRPHRWTRGIDQVGQVCRGFSSVSGVDGTSLPEGAAVLLDNDEVGPVALTFPVGSGRVVAFADGRLFQNEWVGETAAATIFVRAALELVPDGSTLYFDEFHQGFGAGGGVIRSITRFMVQHPWGRTALQALSAVVLLLLLIAWRLGRPEPAPSHARRSPLEHVSALAESYRQAGAVETVRLRMAQGLARRLRRPPPRGADDVAPFLQSLSGTPGASEEGTAVLTAWSDPKTELGELASLIDRFLERVHTR